MKQVSGDLLYFFGYVDYDGNSTPFFNYDKHDPADLAQHYGYKTWNKEVLTLVSFNHEEIGKSSISLKDQEGIDAFTRLIGDNIVDP